MLERLREAYRRWRVRRRRKKLIYAYAKVGRRRYGLGPGFSPLLFAYDRVTNEGLASITTDGDMIWHWPEDAADSVQVEVKDDVDETAEYEADGLVCMFCEAGGFESAEELEQHLDQHPDLARQEVADAD